MSKNIILIYFSAICILNAEPEVCSVKIFSEVRTEIQDENFPDGIRVEYVIKLVNSYDAQTSIEALFLMGVAEMKTFTSKSALHPWAGKPYYLVVMNGGNMHGRVIKYFDGGGSGFYLIDSLSVDERGLLVGDYDDEKLTPISSKSFCDIFSRILTENKK